MRGALRTWLERVVTDHGKQLQDISIVVCSDEYLLSVNRQYLNHDYFTDVITFDYGEGETISGDILLSIDRIRDNAKSLGQSLKTELHRVIVHGILHLLGYSDKTQDEQVAMRAKEDYYLTLREF